MRRLLFSLLLGLSSCITPATLPPEEQVVIEGQIEEESGKPFTEQMVKLDLPLLDTAKAESDASGRYMFELSAARTQFAGTEARLEVSAENEAGSRIEQEFQVGKTQLLLPSMRFWNRLRAPVESFQATLPLSSFSWEAPDKKVQHYVFKLYRQNEDLSWYSETTSKTELTLDPALLVSHQSYRWQVQAHLSDYVATTAPRQFQTQAWPHVSWPIAEIETDQGKRPHWHDNQLKTDAELDYDLEPLTVTIKLKQNQKVTGLHLVASGFTAALDVRVGDKLLSSQTLNGDLLFHFPETQTQSLTLVLRPENGGFVRIRELRVLGQN